MLLAEASSAICVQRFDDSHTSCNSHYVSHFAAFFIVARAKISVVESCLSLLMLQQSEGGSHKAHTPSSKFILKFNTLVQRKGCGKGEPRQHLPLKNGSHVGVDD